MARFERTPHTAAGPAPGARSASVLALVLCAWNSARSSHRRMIVSTQGSTSSAEGTIFVKGVRRFGRGSANPLSPSVSGMPPRLEPMTGIPLIMASMATRG